MFIYGSCTDKLHPEFIKLSQRFTRKFIKRLDDVYRLKERGVLLLFSGGGR